MTTPRDIAAADYIRRLTFPVGMTENERADCEPQGLAMPVHDAQAAARTPALVTWRFDPWEAAAADEMTWEAWCALEITHQRASPDEPACNSPQH